MGRFVLLTAWIGETPYNWERLLTQKWEESTVSAALPGSWWCSRPSGTSFPTSVLCSLLCCFPHFPCSAFTHFLRHIIFSPPCFTHLWGSPRHKGEVKGFLLDPISLPFIPYLSSLPKCFPTLPHHSFLGAEGLLHSGKHWDKNNKTELSLCAICILIIVPLLPFSLCTILFTIHPSYFSFSSCSLLIALVPPASLTLFTKYLP